MSDRVENLSATDQAIRVKQASDTWSGYVTFELDDPDDTFSGTLTFQARLGAAGWKSIAALDLSDMSTWATTATGEGLFRVDASGVDEVRVYATSIAAGTMNVYTKPAIG